MHTMSSQETAEPRELDDDELQLLSAYTGETQLPKLRSHVIGVWRKAVSGPAPAYLCVRGLMFLEPRIKRHPSYEAALQELQRSQTGLWLDVGCAVGTDVRQLLLDGLAPEQVVALDVTPTYWELGLELYKDAGRPPCAAAIFGDITRDDFLPPGSAAGSSCAAGILAGGNVAGQQEERPGPRSGVGSIGQLVGAVQVASCTAVLHCLSKGSVERLLRKILLLLRPGGLLIGSTLGAEEPREWEAAYAAGQARWLHSAASLHAELEAAGYVEVDVQPTSWQDLERFMRLDKLRALAQTHVGTQLDRRIMLAFAARKPAAVAQD